MANKLPVFFDVLNPGVLDALRDLDSKVMTQLKDDIRETVRAIQHAGFINSETPAQTAQNLRSLIGLGPTQVGQVNNFRRALERGDVAKALSYKARDRRSDSAIKKGNLSRDRIAKMTDAYAKRRVTINAQTTARTAATDALKKGQDLTWRQMESAGMVPDGYMLIKSWQTVGDNRVRDAHRAMQGQTVPFNQPYSNGQMIPGEGDYSCRCVSIVTMVAIDSAAGRAALQQADVTIPAPIASSPPVPIERPNDIIPGNEKFLGGTRALVETEQTIREAATESLYIFDDAGNEILALRGGESSVDYTLEQAATFRDNILTHNHPGSSGFSPDDIYTATRFNLAEIRAVGKYADYSLKRPPEGWPAYERIFGSSIERDGFQGIYRKHDNGVRRNLEPLVLSGQLNDKVAGRMHYDLVWRRISEELRGIGKNLGDYRQITYNR